MRLPPWISSRVWIIILFATCVLLLWLHLDRARQVEHISSLVDVQVTVDAASPTGYAGGRRNLIVPERNSDSYQWLAQTQQMLASKEWRVQHVDYDNAPNGRSVFSASPYRWWLGLVALFDHTISNRPVGLSVERAALMADPALQLLLLIGVVIFAARQWGNFAAILICGATAAIFPFGGMFLPGQPGDASLGLVFAVWSVLPLLAGAGRKSSAGGEHRADRKLGQRYFLAAGIAGGIGLWLNPGKQIPFILGIAAGAIIASLATSWRPATPSPKFVPPWRFWALGGAAAGLAGYLIECFPDRLGDFRLEYVHPLYSLAWLGLGDLVARVHSWLHGEKAARNWRNAVFALPAVLVVGAVAVLAARKSGEALVQNDLLASRLSNLPASPVAQNFWPWIVRDGFSLSVVAAILPAILLIPAGWLLLRRRTNVAWREALAIAFGPALATLVLAIFQLRWWNSLDAALLPLLIATAGSLVTDFKSRVSRWSFGGGMLLLLIPGAKLLASPLPANSPDGTTDSDVVALIERDLAHWLSNQHGPGEAVVLAPPNLTVSLYFHGGLAGLGTPYWENKDGFAASIRIAGASSPDEAQAVARGRHLQYIVMPSWDSFLDDYAHLGANDVDHSLIGLLHHWLPPRWLRPVPYQLPKVAGFEGQSVIIFEVVDVQDNATALSHLAEYFVEMGQPRQAVAVSRTLKQLFPADPGAAVAQAMVAQATGDQAEFAAASKRVQEFVARGDDAALGWDRRVSLAIVLAEAKRFDQARAQVQQCLAEMDEARLRSLTTVSLYRLQVLSKGFGLGISDPHLHQLALDLLPPELREGF
jgi:predicted negative regulator of RcsB-dependent stress response